MSSPRVRLRWCSAILLVCACACAWGCIAVSGHLPIHLPIPLRESQSAPRSTLPPPSTSLPLIEVPLPPETRSAGLYKPDQFPDQPQPRPNRNQEPLPLSPPGTYLHTAVLIEGKMYVYGGVASYEKEKYFNDMWLYDFGSSEYVQLQGNYVPPAPNHAGLSTGEAASFAPTDVPSMPGMATAPRHEDHGVERLHTNANPISPFLPTRRAQRPVRVLSLEHIYAADANKPTAAGVTYKQIHGTSEVVKPAFELDAEMREKARLAGKKAEREMLERLMHPNQHPQKSTTPMQQPTVHTPSSRAARLAHAKANFIASTKLRLEREALEQVQAEMRAAEQQPLQQQQPLSQPRPGHDARDGYRNENGIFLETEDHLSMSHGTHHQQRMRMLARTIRALESRRVGRSVDDTSFAEFGKDVDSRYWKNPSTSTTFSRAGGAYAGPRHHRDGVAAEYASEKDGRPIQESNLQQHHPNTETPTSAPSNQREQAPHALQDFWEYEFDTHSWQLVGINSSQPLAHSPWLTPSQLNDPVFKDPLPVLLPPTRRLHTAVVMKDRMIVFGGVSYNNLILGDLWIFDPAESSWIEASADGPGGSPILPREGHTAIVAKDGLSMLVFGGVSYGFLPFNDLWTYSAVDNAWYRLSSSKDPNAPMQRWLHTAVHHDKSDSMIIFGGITAHYVPLNDVHVYDIQNKTWKMMTCLDTPPFPRMMHTAVTINDIMLVTGGAANNLPMDDMFLLDLKTWRWKELLQTSGYPFARTGSSAIILSPRLRSAEKLELEDQSADADDPHLQYAVDQTKVAHRTVVGSFSSEGLASNEEQDGNIVGLDEIAFPKDPVVDGNEDKVSPRPIYRYRKHMVNNYFMILFGGASATTTPQDQTHLVKEQDDSQPSLNPKSMAFLEVDTELSGSSDSDSDAVTDAEFEASFEHELHAVQVADGDVEAESETDATTESDAAFEANFASELKAVQEADSVANGEVATQAEIETDADVDANAAFDAEFEHELEVVQSSDAAQEGAASVESTDTLASDVEVEVEAESDAEFESEWSEAMKEVRQDGADGIFLEVASSFSPEQVAEHKSGQIGKMREQRTRAHRIATKRGVEPSNTANPREGEDPDSYGPYDERRVDEEARVFAPSTDAGMDAERMQRLGTVRPVGLSRAPFCATFPWCQQTPPPPDVAVLPPPENPEVIRAEMARLDPMKFLPTKLEELKKDPHRFGEVFQYIYKKNKHNEKLANKMAGTDM